MFELQQRKEPSRTMVWVTPILAVILTMLAGSVLFAALGKDPVEVVRLIFVQPLLDPFSRTELLVKGTPLVLIAIGLSFGFRAGVWNIGAEGQFIIGAIAGGAVGLAFYDVPGFWLLPLMALAGAAAGAAWAMIPAVLRIKFNANEILVSLMLVYVAELLLSALVSGPLRDPDGFNFPESRLFHDSATLPIIIESSRAHAGVLAALGVVVAAYVLLERHLFGFQVRLFGQALVLRVSPDFGRGVWWRSASGFPVRWPGWPGFSKRQGLSASSFRGFRRAMALPPLSLPFSGGCTPSAFSLPGQ